MSITLAAAALASLISLCTHLHNEIKAVSDCTDQDSHASPQCWAMHVLHFSTAYLYCCQCCLVDALALPNAQAYTLQRIQHFAFHFARRINPALTKEQVDYVTSEVLGSLAAMQEALPPMPQQNLRLVLRHDCL